MGKILIAYYSRTGNTEAMANLVAEGARQGGADVTVKKIQDVQVKELQNYDGFIFGSPTYYGSMAWEMKRLLDQSVELHGKLSGKVGAAFASSANIAGGNETTVLDILKAFLIHGMIVQGDPFGDHYGPVAIDAPDDRAAKECERLGLRVAKLLKVLSGK